MDWQELMREVGVLTQDNQLVRGVLTTGAAVLAVVLTGWRVLRRKADVPRVKIDAPANVEVSVKPVPTGKTITLPLARYRPRTDGDREWDLEFPKNN